MTKERAFDITYHNGRLGVPCVKSHRIVAETKAKAVEGLIYWKSAKPEDIISIEDRGEFEVQSGFTIKR